MICRRVVLVWPEVIGRGGGGEGGGGRRVLSERGGCLSTCVPMHACFIDILRADDFIAVPRPVYDRRRETRSLDAVGVSCGVQTRQRERVRERERQRKKEADRQRQTDRQRDRSRTGTRKL